MILKEYCPLHFTDVSTSSPMLLSTTRKGMGLAVPNRLPMISLMLKKYTLWSLPVSPPMVKRLPILLKVFITLSPRLP